MHANRHRPIALLLVSVALATACGSPPPSPAQIEVGVPDPTIDWERTAERLVYVGSGPAPTDAEVDLVAQVVDDLPTSLITMAEVRWVVRSGGEQAIRSDHPSAVAFAVGADIYLLDGAFNLSEGGSTRFDLGRALAHELVHVAQFQTLDPAYVEAVQSGAIDQLDPIAGSLLVRDFVAATAWTNTSDDALRPQWTLSGQASTAYGATDPGEDMAEAVAMVVMGLGELIPETHRLWVEGWLGAPIDALALGQPWAPAGSAEVLAESALYDQAAVDSLQGSLTRREPLYFALPPDVGDTRTLARLIEDRLRARVMAGSLEELPDNQVPRLGGGFSSPSGRIWWVELWDFRHAAPGTGGPATPILVYVALW